MTASLKPLDPKLIKSKLKVVTMATTPKSADISSRARTIVATNGPEATALRRIPSLPRLELRAVEVRCLQLQGGKRRGRRMGSFPLLSRVTQRATGARLLRFIPSTVGRISIGISANRDLCCEASQSA